MEINPENLNTRDFYTWMVHTVVPRPIAWVSTMSSTGGSNLAPFSFFNAVCARPPILMFCPANDRHGRPKDTLRNIEANGEFVVNIVPWTLAAAMNSTAAPLPPEESEFVRFGVEPAPSVRVKPPRVAASPVSYECALDRIVRFGEGPAAGNAVFGRILLLHVKEEVLGADGWPDAARLDPCGRLGGEGYARLGERLRLTRPE